MVACRRIRISAKLQKHVTAFCLSRRHLRLETAGRTNPLRWPTAWTEPFARAPERAVCPQGSSPIMLQHPAVLHTLRTCQGCYRRS